jgi:hypothetical protein
MHHLTIRAAWHDRQWNGTVCAAPTSNGFCVALDRIREKRDDAADHARAARIDNRRAKENPSEALRRPATRLATAILMYSFGGLRREGGKEVALAPPIVHRSEAAPTLRNA